MARASDIDADIRRDCPFAAYGDLRFRVPVHESGDVKARTLVRVEEVRESAGLIRQALAAMPAGDLTVEVAAMPAYEPAFGLVEGWRGAIFHWVTISEPVPRPADTTLRRRVCVTSLRAFVSSWPALVPSCLRGYNSRSAVTTGNRAARMAGSIPPKNPITRAKVRPCTRRGGVTAKANAIWVKVCQLSVAVW